MAVASIKSKGGWKGEKKFCLGISVGQNHTGEALSAVIDWLNKSSFNTGIIDLSDNLKIYILNEPEITKMHRKQFDAYWGTAVPPEIAKDV
jgi:hypothetical protein